VRQLSASGPLAHRAPVREVQDEADDWTGHQASPPSSENEERQRREGLIAVACQPSSRCRQRQTFRYSSQSGLSAIKKILRIMSDSRCHLCRNNESPNRRPGPSCSSAAPERREALGRLRGVVEVTRFSEAQARWPGKFS